MNNNLPKTVDQAVERLISELSLKEKTAISNMKEPDLVNLHFSLGMDIRNRFDLWNNKKLMNSCRDLANDYFLNDDSASGLIISMLWKRVQIIKKIRVVK